MGIWAETNINYYIKVKLNGRGFEQHREALRPILGDKYTPPTADSDGWCKFQLWEFARIFGPHLFNGCKVGMETPVMIEVADPAK